MRFVEEEGVRHSIIKPANSRWSEGWLISMTSIGDFLMVQYPGDRPFVLSRSEWDVLPDDICGRLDFLKIVG